MITVAQAEESFRSLWEDVLRSTGRSLQTSSAEIAAYVAERSVVLAAAVNEPGYEEAVRAEVPAFLHRLEIEGIDEADAVDARLIGVVHASFGLLSRMLAPPAA